MRKLIRVGKERDGLSYFTTDYAKSRHGKANTVSGSAVLWHQRLGHPSNDRLASIPNFSHIRFNKICQECIVCPLAKAFRQVFSPNINKSITPFHLVHIDIWGPYQTPSSSGARFFLTLVDDCTRAVWTYLLKHKNEACHVFQNFYSLIQTQFGFQIK